MKFPYIMGVWWPSLIEATHFLNQWRLGDNVVQFIPDAQMKRGFWVMLRVTGYQEQALREAGIAAKPKWSLL